jgi:hypothetical protein
MHRKAKRKNAEIENVGIEYLVYLYVNKFISRCRLEKNSVLNHS